MQHEVDFAADGGVSGQKGGVTCRMVGLGTDVEALRWKLHAGGAAHADVEFVAVVFFDGGFGGVPFVVGQAFPVLDEDDVAELFFAAGFEQGVVAVGRRYGDDEVGAAGDFVEVGVGGESRNRAVAEVDGCDLTLKRCAQEVAQDAFAQAIWAFARAHENDVVGHEEVAGHGLGGHGASFSVCGRCVSDDLSGGLGWKGCVMSERDWAFVVGFVING